MLCAAPGDHGLDAPCPDLAAVLVVVIAAVGEQHLRALTWAADLPRDGLHAVDQRQELGYVVAVPASQRERQRQSASVSQDVMLRARAGTVDRRGAGEEPPKSARI